MRVRVLPRRTGWDSDKQIHRFENEQFDFPDEIIPRMTAGLPDTWWEPIDGWDSYFAKKALSENKNSDGESTDLESIDSRKSVRNKN